MVPFYREILWGWIALAVIVFLALQKIAAPYGRHFRGSDRLTVLNHLGWLLMELPAVLVFGWFFVRGAAEIAFVNWLFFIFWQVHYLNRSLFFPFRLKNKGKRVRVVIVFSALFFNCVNGFLNGHYLGAIAPAYPFTWLTDSRFIAGVALFVLGMAINWRADAVLLALRKTGEYRIPKGGLFRYVSCPNYFGEMVEWLGFAIMTWALPAFAFFLWTAANLIPRAQQHHRWYRQQFENYPASRKALIPFVL